MQIDDILLLRMNRQYLFAPAKDEFTVLRDLCGLQAQFYGNCLHALRLRCGKAPDEDILRTSAVKTWTLRGVFTLAGIVRPSILLDGKIVGVWKRRGKAVELTGLMPLQALQRKRIEEEALRIFGDSVSKLVWRD